MTGPTGAAGTGGGIAPLIAAATVNADGTFPGDHPGFSGVAHQGTGIYQLGLTSFPGNANDLIVNATLAGIVPGQITWIAGVGATILVHTFNASGVPADAVFTIACFDTTP